MTIIKEFPDDAIFFRILLCISIVMIISLVLYVWKNKCCENERSDFLISSIICAIIGIVIFISSLFIDTNGKHYRIHVDDDVTIGELLDTYKVLDYDNDYNVWEVKEKTKNE